MQSFVHFFTSYKNPESFRYSYFVEVPRRAMTRLLGDTRKRVQYDQGSIMLIR